MHFAIPHPVFAKFFGIYRRNRSVVFFNEEIEIHFNTPTKSPDESQGFCFLETKYIDYIMRMFV